MAWTFELAWSEPRPVPSQMRFLRTLSWNQFQTWVEQETHFVEMFVRTISGGDAWILKGAFPKDFIDSMREKSIAWCKDRESSYHPILDGVPDFHRHIDLETGKKYAIKGCKHSAYYFPWNGDPLGIYPEVWKRWRVIKKAMGLKPDAYEKNKPSEGVVDRIQVIRYPPSIGYLEPHKDPSANQVCFISGIMSKRGVDYHGGGFYFVVDGKAVFVEDRFDVGDICIGHADLLHGVAPCDRGNPVDWSKSDGRWFLGLYSTESNYSQNRNTTRPEPIEVEGVLP